MTRNDTSNLKATILGIPPHKINVQGNFGISDGNDRIRVSFRLRRLPHFREPFFDMRGKCDFHSGRESDGSVVAEMKDNLADVFIRRGIFLAPAVVTEVLRIPWEGGSKIDYFVRPLVDGPDFGDAQ